MRSRAVLVAALSHPSPRARLRAAKELTRRRDAVVVRPLTQIVRLCDDADAVEEALHLLRTVIEVAPGAIAIRDLERLAALDLPDVHYRAEDQKTFLMDQGRYPAQPSDVCSLARRALNQRARA